MLVTLPIEAATPYKRGNFRDSHTAEEERDLVFNGNK